MPFIERIKESSVKNLFYQNRFGFLLFIGLLMVIFALLRVYHWDHQDVKLVCGIGLILFLLGFDFNLKSKITFVGILGFVFACSPVLIYYFLEHRATDDLSLLYAIGLTLIIFDIFSTNFFRGLEKKINDLSENLKMEIYTSVQPKFIEFSSSVEDLADLALDVWRIENKITKLKGNINDNQLKQFENNFKRLKRLLKKYEIEVLEYTNQKYNEGLNVDILSIERDPETAFSYIRETIEPTILCKGKILKRGKVIVVEQ